MEETDKSKQELIEEINLLKQKLAENGNCCDELSKQKNSILPWEDVNLLYRLVPSAIFTIDLERKVTSWNGKVEEITGYSADEAIGKNCLFFANTPCKDNCGLFNENIKKPIFSRECTIITKAGEVRNVIKNVDYLKDKEGNIIGGIESFDDVTELKKAEKSLLDERNMLIALMNSIPDNIFFKDTQSRFTNVNKALIRWFRQMEITDIIGKTDLDFFSDEHAIEAYNDEQQIMKTGIPIINKVEKETWPDGRIYWVNTSKVPLFDLSGAIVGIVGISRDITSQKTYESKLEESEQKLQEVNTTKDKFFSILAHDLKNPFNAIMGLAHFLHTDYDYFTEDEKKEYIKDINDASESAFKLLENVLQWSRAQTSKISITPELIDLSLITNENISVLKAHALNKNIKLQSFIKYNTIVYADPNMVTTVIRNLISNAIKFTNDGGQVTISSQILDDSIEIKVNDTGTGISETNLKKLFRIDEQFNVPGTNGEQGTGLGLILCKEFIERNNGTIRVESVIASGSSFYFTLPRFAQR